MSWKYVCAAGDVAENTLKKLDVEGVPLVVANYGSGFRAFPTMCPHMEEPLAESGVLAKCVLTCTKHLWAWNLETLEMEGPAEKPLKTYDLKQEDGSIFAFIEEELLYDFEEEEDDMGDDFFART
jgi:toluene monooxygenase system ferredoxin subunit